MTKKKLFIIVSGLLIVMMAFASVAAAKTMSKKQELIYNSYGEPETLDPALSTGVPEATLEMVCFEGLVRLDDNNLPVPGIAERWDASEDLMVYTFYLRKDAKWQDGKPVTAKDFEYSWKRVLNPETASQYAYMLYYIKNGEAYNTDETGKFDPNTVGVKALDDYTLEVTLEAPTPYFLQVAAFQTLYPVRKDIVEANPDSWATKPETYIGNGPFKMVGWDHNSQITFVKNENYWDKENVKLDKLIVTLVDNNQTAVTMFNTGHIDLLDSPPSENIDGLKAAGKYFVQPGVSSYYYICNVAEPGVDNPLVRRALAMAINRKIIVEEVTKGGQIPAMSFVPGELIDAEPGTTFREVGGDFFKDYDVEGAKKLLAEAGYPNGKGLPTFEILYNTESVGHQNIALAIQSWWAAIGVKSQLVGQEWGVYLQTRDEMNYQISRAGWGADYLDPMTFMDLHVTGGGNNDAGYSNPNYDAFIKIAKMTDDQKIRMFAMHEAERILMEDMPIIPIYFYTDSWAAQPYVEGIIYNPFGSRDFKFAWISE